jgi:hypothetical protein
MSEELSVGVKILLERCKTNPDEIMGTKWLNVVEAVFNYKETRARSPSLRGLTEQEIDLIYEALNGLYRSKFDSYIMANVLNADEEKPELDMYELSQGKHPLPPGSWQNVAVQTSNTPIVTTLKSALGLK